MMKQTFLRLLSTLIVFLPLACQGQEVRHYNSTKLTAWTVAIAKAEGFYTRGTLPNRYHNPGDLKINAQTADRLNLKGYRGVGKGGHTIFRTDAAGQAALREITLMMIDGRSKCYNRDMTISDVARHYAGNWRRWAKNVSHELNVSPDTTLSEFFEVELEPPVLNLPSPDGSVLSAVLSVPVNMPVLAQN